MHDPLREEEAAEEEEEAKAAEAAAAGTAGAAGGKCAPRRRYVRVCSGVSSSPEVLHSSPGCPNGCRCGTRTASPSDHVM